jgi:hypothetical protein
MTLKKRFPHLKHVGLVGRTILEFKHKTAGMVHMKLIWLVVRVFGAMVIADLQL